jgi:hypothetical protein
VARKLIADDHDQSESAPEGCRAAGAASASGCSAVTRHVAEWTATEDSKAARIGAELPYNPEVMKMPETVKLTEPGVEGSYVVEERRADGTLVLRPERERLSEVAAETEGQVFDGAEFIEHLERVARAEDDLPADAGE